MLEEFGGLPRMSPFWVICAYGGGSLGGWLFVRRKYR
jgi:hypothetical protein